MVRSLALTEYLRQYFGTTHHLKVKNALAGEELFAICIFASPVNGVNS